MATRGMAALCGLFLFLVACDLEPDIQGPDPAASPPGVEDAFQMASGCQDGWEYKPATLGAGVPYDTGFIQESCGPHPDYFGTTWCSQSPVPVTLEVKSGPDHAIFWCDGTTRTLMSNGWTPGGILIIPPGQHSCWDCLGNCATQGQCPPGATDCRVVPGNTDGSDCRAVYCDPGWHVYGDFPNTPICRRACTGGPPDPPIQVTIHGPTEIQPDATCTWSAGASGGNGGPFTFNWYNENMWAGSGTYYTGGRPNGTIHPEFRLRLEASDGTNTGSTQITVYEDPNAMICMM